MSLAPNERRALAGIEHALCSSDPRLAAMLATFTLPLTVRMIACLSRLLPWRRAKRFVWTTIILTTACAITLSWLIVT